jgi:protein-export membrane protein SecD
MRLYVSRRNSVIICLILLIATFIAAQNLVTKEDLAKWPSWLPKGHVTLGLDLQGGAQLLLEVDTDSVLRTQLNNASDTVRNTLRDEKIAFKPVTINNNQIIVSLTRQADSALAQQKLREALPDFAITAEDPLNFALVLQPTALSRIETQAVNQSIEVIRRRVDETGTLELSIQRQGANRIMLQVPGIKDPKQIEERLGKVARLTFHLVDETVSPEAIRSGQVPASLQIVPMDQSSEMDGALALQRRVIVTGADLTGATYTLHQNTPAVSFQLNSLGARRFGEMTRENLKRRFAIVLDNKIISAPRIDSPIFGGSGVIYGSFTEESAAELALLLRAGALPAPLKVEQNVLIGPDLGADSIEAGKIASLIALVMIGVAMVVFYGLLGMLANIGLIFNGIMLLALLSLLGATLTLPGIAGIVLTLGMAVDANVLIFERIREEMRNGRSAILALDYGFNAARGTIIDANLTTLIAGLILFLLGAGPVQGFAVTLSLGILTSVFTSVTVTRMVIGWWHKLARPQTIPL